MSLSTWGWGNAFRSSGYCRRQLWLAVGEDGFRPPFLLVTEGGQPTPLRGILIFVRAFEGGNSRNFTAVDGRTVDQLQTKIFSEVDRRIAREWGLDGDVVLGEPKPILSWTPRCGQTRACFFVFTGSGSTLDRVSENASVAFRVERCQGKGRRSDFYYIEHDPWQEQSWDGFLVTVEGFCLTDKSDFV